jgi:hypothetical protein
MKSENLEFVAAITVGPFIFYVLTAFSYKELLMWAMFIFLLLENLFSIHYHLKNFKPRPAKAAVARSVYVAAVIISGHTAGQFEDSQR